MPKVISNTSCLIVLDNIDMLGILKDLYGSIIKKFQRNLVKLSLIGLMLEKLVNDKKYLELMKNFVDLGEASTIALAVEVDNNITILDDLKTRKIAKKLNIKMTGTLGVIINAKKKVLNKLKDAGFRLSKEIENVILKYNM